MKIIATASLLLLSAVCATSASANYFFNSRWGTMLNVGSAPNPTPQQLRAIGDSRVSPPADEARARGSVVPTSVTVIPTRASAPPAMASAVTMRTQVVARPLSPKAEKRVTAELNRASLLRANAEVKGKAPANTAAVTNAGKKPRV